MEVWNRSHRLRLMKEFLFWGSIFDYCSASCFCERGCFGTQTKLSCCQILVCEIETLTDGCVDKKRRNIVVEVIHKCGRDIWGTVENKNSVELDFYADYN